MVMVEIDTPAQTFENEETIGRANANLVDIWGNPNRTYPITTSIQHIFVSQSMHHQITKIQNY